MRITDSIADKQNIYNNGRNALPMSLASLSLFAGDTYAADPMFNIYKRAFLDLGMAQEDDTDGYFDGFPVNEYGNTLVNDLFLLNITRIEAEGALSLNIMMAVWGSLYETVRACGRNDANTQEDMYAALDQAAALWVGTDQVKDDNQSGYLMYNLAEYAGALFGQDSGESLLNTLVLESFNFLRQDADKNTCANGINGYVVVREKVKILISFTNAVLVQMLLHYVKNALTAGSDFVEMYALALLPQIAACDTGLYNTLLELAVDTDVTAESQPLIIKAIQDSFSCLGVTCDDVGQYEGGRIAACNDSAKGGLLSLTEYPPLTDVRRKSYIDRDIRAINIFMQLNAYDAAKDYYLHGWSTFFSLSDLAQNDFSPGPAPDFDLYNAYYNGNEYDFAHNIIMNVLERQEPFDAASSKQREHVVEGVLRGVVMYLSTLAELDSAIGECELSGGSDKTLDLWDGGAAFFIGSSEGQRSGGQEDGQLLFGLAKERCDVFGTCEPDNAPTNEVIVQALLFGSVQLQTGDCGQAKTILDGSIKPVLLVPLIQSVLYFASESSGLGVGSTSGKLGSLHAWSRAVLPAIDAVSGTSAVTINNNSAFQPASTPVADGIDAVFGAFRNTLELIPTDCNEIGELTTGGVKRSTCVGNVPAPQPQPNPVATTTTTPTKSPVAAPSPVPVARPSSKLGFGRYDFINPSTSESDAKFAIDIKDMFFADVVSDALSIYREGSNVPLGLSGEHDVMSLSGFSTMASQFMSQDPMYNFYRYALYEDVSFDSQDTGDDWPFADAIVQLALSLDNGNDSQLASVAVVVTNVWMLVVHRMYAALRTCEAGYDAGTLIDSSVSLWLGAEQEEGKFASGWMLYAVAQLAARQYGLDEKEAKVNKDLMDLFNEAQTIAQTCGDGTADVQKLRRTVHEIVRVLSIPLLQHLLYYMSEDDMDYVELFSVAFVPQTAACDLQGFSTLEDALFEGFKRDETIDYELLSQFGKSLRCLRFTCADLGDTTNASDKLKSLVSTLCTEIDVGYDPKFLAAYETDYDVSELARIDLDIHQIDVLMRSLAYEAALDYYVNGANSLTSSGEYLSLKSLATDPTRVNAGDIFDLYRNYYSNDDYADEIITLILEAAGGGAFAEASRPQKAEAVTRSLQTMVSYMQVVSKLRSAIGTCKETSGQPGQLQVDEAVALYVGSIEGPRSGGSSNGVGKMMFALAKETCADFNKCESHGDATVNSFLMFAFEDMKQWFKKEDCESAASILEESILPMLPVALVQGTLEYAVANEILQSRSGVASLAIGTILSSAVLPLVDNVDATEAAEILDNMDFNPNQQPVMDGSDAVFDSFAAVLRGMGIDCDSVGTMVSKGRSLCDNTEDAPLPTTPTNLGVDLYISTTYVQDRANIALDIKGMEDALTSGREDLAEIIYKIGENSNAYDSFGKEVGPRTLSGFSTDAALSMPDNPLYQVTVFALRDNQGRYLGTDAGRYADTIVQEALITGAQTRSTLAAEAAVALNLWMELANELFQTLKNCKDKRIVDEDGIHSIDEAAAYWIGDGQVAGDSERGHLLYALAERMGENFGLNDAGQSRTNTNILRLFHQAKLELSFTDSCSENPNTVRRLRHIVNKITTQMIIVNVQGLIHNLRVNDRDRVHIYAHAVVPLVAGCDPTTFAYLKSRLLGGSAFQEVDVESIITALGKSYPCFGIQCADVGVHTTEAVSSCRDPPMLSPLAGYRPASDVRGYAHLDYDIQELDILMQMEAYSAAEELYLYGKHASTGNEDDRTALSLSYLATSSGRSIVPQFDAYKRFYDGNEKYADTIIFGALRAADGASTERRMIVARGSQYMVVFMAVLQAMNEAISSCQSSSDNRGSSSAQSWDRAAAFIVGHMEGSDEGGSRTGRMLWGLAKQQCREFGTCSSIVDGSAEVNDQIVSLLYSGRGAIVSGSCSALRKSARELTPLLQVPLIQAALSSTFELAKSSSSDYRNRVWAEAYIYSQAILPLIEDANRDSAEIVASNLDFSGPALSGGVEAVVSAFAKSYSGMGIDCQEIGTSNDFDACTGVVQGKSGREKVGVIFGILIGCLAAVGTVLLLRSKRRHKTQQEAPVFVIPKGELNHTSDLIMKPPESVIRQDIETDGLTNKYNDTDAADADGDASEAEHDDDYQGDYIENSVSDMTGERTQVV